MTSGIKAPTWRRPALRIAVLSTLAVSIFSLHPSPTALQKVQTQGELTVIGVSSATTPLQQDSNARIQYELAQRFADQLGVHLTLVNAPDANTALASVRQGKADLAITSLGADAPRLRVLHMGAATGQVGSQELVQRASQAPVTSMDALGDAAIVVAAGSAEADQLNKFAAAHQGLKVIEVAEANPIKLLDMVNNQQADYAVVNTIEFDSRRTLFPDLAPASQLNQQPELAWAFKTRGDPSLAKAAQRFMDRAQADGSLARLASFYGQQPETDSTAANSNLQEFNDAVASRLPHYRKLFEQSAKHADMDWRLLASIAYQESKWQAEAVSPTGVQGMMMLTQSTADYLNVDNRANASQSIRGGARYFKEIADSLPATVHEPDRTWMALAAYNIGPGYLERARTLTDAAGDDADKWLDVSSHLKEMAEDGRRAGHATASVSHALAYVEDVRRYYDALLLSGDNDTRVAMNTRVKTQR